MAARLRDAGVDEAMAAWPLGLVAAGLLALAQAALGAPGILAPMLVGAAMAAGIADALVARHWRRLGTRMRRQRRASRHICTGLTATAALLLGILPWLQPSAQAQAPGVALAVLVLAPLLALSVAPLGPAVALQAAVPLSFALAFAQRGALAPIGLLAACIACTVLTPAVALQAHRRWRRLALALLQRDDAQRAQDLALAAAQQADREKSRFLAIASHDLRQPVHAIGLFAATLDKRLEGSAEQPLVRNLNRAIAGLDRSFNVMLDISRLDAGAVEPRIQNFRLRDLFRRLHMHYAGQAEQKGLGLRFSPGGKSVNSDPQLLERVLGNLLQNAIRYTQAGGIVVVARTTASHLHVEVWDTGIGIAPADLPKIFDEFYQVAGGQRVRSQGLGMGLAIVKRLVRLLGHELQVASRPGRGTMFRLRIARGGLDGIERMTAAADTVPMGPLQPRTVLVLDDEETIREGLGMLLQEWGYDVIAAGSIAEALQGLRQLESPPDLILSDLHLGEGPDGIAAIGAIRRECGCDVTAMLITGDTTAAEMRRATESGHAVLFKPVQPRKLYDALLALG